MQLPQNVNVATTAINNCSIKDCCELTAVAVVCGVCSTKSDQLLNSSDKKSQLIENDLQLTFCDAGREYVKRRQLHKP